MSDQIAKPERIGVFILEAKSAEEANAICKRRRAYVEIITKYPSTVYDRRYIGTRLMDQGAGWLVEFEIKPKGMPDNG